MQRTYASPVASSAYRQLGAKHAKEEEEEFKACRWQTLGLGAYFLLHSLVLCTALCYSLKYGLLLGKLGISFEVLALWLVLVQAVDLSGWLVRACALRGTGKLLPAAPDAAASVFMGLLPVLGPKTDLVKDMLFAAQSFAQGACSEVVWQQYAGQVIGYLGVLSMIIPGLYLLSDPVMRRELAEEFVPALAVRAKSVGAAEAALAAPATSYQDMAIEFANKATKFALKKAAAQATSAKEWNSAADKWVNTNGFTACFRLFDRSYIWVLPSNLCASVFVVLF